MPIADDVIEGDPTKGFFIYMLTRDIPIEQSIADLLDNCIDGAKRLRPGGDYTGLWVRLEANPDHFRISDNCGGIPVEIARKYAFRFGRPEGMPATAHSIGQFGVGMKRALFKIGYVFRVESTTDVSRFVVDQDVRKWAANKDDWDFHFSELEEAPQPAERERGTILQVTDIIGPIKGDFALENFQTRLNGKLTTFHQDAISKGLAVTLNSTPLAMTVTTLLSSSDFSAAKKTLEYGSGRESVKVTLCAGLASSNPSTAGWDVFCNGRLVLASDRSATTGWGDGIPNYHNEYARFRGYAFFDSDNSALLPWTTTKSDVNRESEYFKATRAEMISMMRPIIDFLIKIAAEKKRSESDDPTDLEQKVLSAQAFPLAVFTNDATFSPPRVVIPAVPAIPTQQIAYRMPNTEIEKVKRSLDVRTLREVGEKTFKYYAEMECD